MIELATFLFNLQLFADEGTDGGGAATGDAGQEGGERDKGSDGADKGGDGGDKTFTQEDINKIISDRLAKEKGKWEKDYQAKLEQAKTEAEKLAKMNADQKAEYEKQKREEELAKREGDITRRELRAQALEALAEKGLPKQLAEILVYSDAEATNKSLEAVEKAFREAVEAGVNERLKGDPPKGGAAAQNAAFAEIEKIFQRR